MDSVVGQVTGCGDFLGIPTWYKYISTDGCNIPANVDLLGGDFWLVAVAIVEILLRIAAYAALVFVIYGGIKITMSGGNSSGVAEGRGAIISAIVGFVIAIMASSVVGFIGSELAASNAETAGNNSPIQVVLNIVYRVATGITVLYVALAGLRFVTANGDPGSIQQARNSIVYAVIGLVVTLAAVAILAFVGGSV